MEVLPRPMNEQLMMSTGGPPSIRQLAEQTFALQQEDERENSVRRQRDDTIFKRSVDPTLSMDRGEQPAEGIARHTKDGVIRRNIRRKIERREEEEQEEEEVRKPAVQLHEVEKSTNTAQSPIPLIIAILIFSGLIGTGVYIFAKKNK